MSIPLPVAPRFFAVRVTVSVAALAVTGSVVFALIAAAREWRSLPPYLLLQRSTECAHQQYREITPVAVGALLTLMVPVAATMESESSSSGRIQTSAAVSFSDTPPSWPAEFPLSGQLTDGIRRGNSLEYRGLSRY
jgi:hypothetical protein